MKIDIIVPTYNRSEILGETLDSVQNQTFQDWKCWIAEDGETQKTYMAVKPYLADDRFVYLPGNHSGSPARPRNRGVMSGTFEYIAFLDDDDIWLPTKLQCQLEFMEGRPECVLSGCNAYRLSGSKKWDQNLSLYFQKKKFFGKIPYTALVQDNYFIASSVMIRRNVLNQSGLFNENLSPLEVMADDYELWLRIGVLGETWNLTDPCLIYRETPQTFYSKLNREDNYKSRANILDRALQGVEGVQSPLSYPENRQLAAACRYERDFYLAGPRFLGRFRHELALKIRNFLSISF
ncbi:MAG: glycosyltransferase family A protein [Desulfobacterales bacterium]|jgi:teichuronic acid biosynthesis glycosyltransferase TuaG